MRRYSLISLFALAAVVGTAVGACGTATPAVPRTVTKIVTAGGPGPAPTGSTGITVIQPSTTPPAGGSGGSAAQTSPTGSPSSAVSSGGPSASGAQGGSGSTSASAPSSGTVAVTGPVVKVDPLHVSCPALLDPNDISKALGATVSSASSRIVDVANPEVKMTGKVKCYYGVTTGSDARPVTVALAQYASAGDAQKQMDVTASSEVGLGAKASAVTVSGEQAKVLLRDGGLLIMRYDTWTLAVAVQSGLAPADKEPDGLQQLATMVLARVLKNG